MTPGPIKEPQEAFRYLRDHEARLLQFQFSVSTWIIGALLTVNSGALIAVLNAMGERPALAGSGTPFIVGLVATILCGLSLWFNVVCNSEAVTDRIDWENLSIQDPPSADKWDGKASACAWIAMGALVVSLSSFTWGALKVQSAFEVAEKVAVEARDATKVSAVPKK